MLGETRDPRDHRRGPPRQLLGEIRGHCIRYFTKSDVDELLVKESQPELKRPRNTLLLLLHHSTRHLRHVGSSAQLW